MNVSRVMNRLDRQDTCNCRRSGSRQAFTLVELLVVIAIIGILMALLLPGLSRSKARAVQVACLNNLKQLQVCNHLYTLDNADRLPPNNYVYDIDTQEPMPGFSTTMTWCPGLAPFDTNADNVRSGLLFRYNTSVAIYHCPADHSTAETTNGLALPILRSRSYNLSNAINGRPTAPAWEILPPSFQKESLINNPGPSSLFTFLDVHEQEITDSTFGIMPAGGLRLYGTERWWDLPANRHSQGCNLAFADGHVEHWRWAAPKIFVEMGQPIRDVADMKDFRRLQAGVPAETRFHF